MKRLCLLVVSILSLVACGGGGSGGADPGIAWINIKTSSVAVVNNTPSCLLSGDAFISGNYVFHYCVGFECFGVFDNSYPGVDVTWTNLTTGSRGVAVSRYGSATNWDHIYSASVPLIVGVNELKITASDLAGNIASTNTYVEY